MNEEILSGISSRRTSGPYVGTENRIAFGIFGEAANRLPEEFKQRHPDIDWHRIRGFRNRIIHDYLGIDFAIV